MESTVVLVTNGDTRVTKVARPVKIIAPKYLDLLPFVKLHSNCHLFNIQFTPKNPRMKIAHAYLPLHKLYVPDYINEIIKGEQYMEWKIKTTGDIGHNLRLSEQKMP
jgi:hypothetical protein